MVFKSWVVFGVGFFTFNCPDIRVCACACVQAHACVGGCSCCMCWILTICTCKECVSAYGLCKLGTLSILLLTETMLSGFKPCGHQSEASWVGTQLSHQKSKNLAHSTGHDTINSKYNQVHNTHISITTCPFNWQKYYKEIFHDIYSTKSKQNSSNHSVWFTVLIRSNSHIL